MTFSEYMLDQVLVFLIVFYLSYVFYRRLPAWLDVENSGPPPLPPTVRSFPIIGSALSLPQFKDLHKWFLDESDHHGYVIGFYAGRRYAVVLQTRQLVDEAFVQNAEQFAGRPCTYARKLCNPSGFGIIDRRYNSEFEKYRCLSQNFLQHCAFGKGAMESHIHFVTTSAIEKLKELNGKLFDPQNIINSSVMSTLWSVLFGLRVDGSSAHMQQVLHWTLDFCHRKQSAAIVDVFPLSWFSRKLRHDISLISDAQRQLLDCLNKAVDECLANDQNVSLARCYCDTEGVGFDRRELLYLLRDLVSTGVEMVSATLQWALLLLANHAKVQRHCQQEIDSVLTAGRLPSAGDQARLPYVEATVLETMRCKTVAPMSILRETVCDALLAAHCIPAGTLVFANLYALHMDPVIWPDPTEFIPERFITSAGQLVDFRMEKVIPYSIGKRSCIVEALSQKFILVFLAGLLQQFDIRPPDGQDEIDSSEDFHVVVTPFPYRVSLVPR